MACPQQNGGIDAVTAVLDSFVFTEYVGEGDLVEYGDTEFESSTQYSNTKQKVRFSGETIPKMQVTLNIFPCDPVWEATYQAHIRNTLSCFTSLIVNDPTCAVRRFRDVRIISMSPPNVSADTTVAPIVLEGTPIQ